jgi:FAD/FMN-containing dehydrogenase
MEEGSPLDRRAFLANASAGAGFALLAGCGGGSGTTNALSVAARRAGAKTTPGPPIPRTLRSAIRGQVITRNDPGFAAAAHVYDDRFDQVRPRAVARPLNPLDVTAAVRWCIAHDVPLRARSGGHSYAGYSTLENGVVLDLRQLRAITVDRRAATATIGAGSQLIDVYAGLAAHGATLPAGSCPSVGVAGHSLGGGMGLAGRAFGLSADNLVAVKLVTADGRLRSVDRRHDPDLLWALRGGGGGNFGVVTELTFRVRRLPSSASAFFVRWPWSSASAAIEAWLAWAPHARDELTSILHLDAGPVPALRITGQYIGPASDLGRLLAPLAGVPGATVSSRDHDYLGLQVLWAGCSAMTRAACHTVGTRPGATLPRMRFWAKSDYLRKPLPASGRAALIRAVEHHPGPAAILFDAYGGAINRIPPGATAFVHRHELCAIQYYGSDPGWTRSAHAAMRPYVSGMAYQNYIDAELADWRRAYYGSNYAKLVAIRRRVDPDHRFDFPQAIGR